MGSLQTILSDFPYDNLPPAWTAGDLASFSRGKTLWDYQQASLRNALREGIEAYVKAPLLAWMFHRPMTWRLRRRP
jgi:hypothetical protein